MREVIRCESKDMLVSFALLSVGLDWTHLPCPIEDGGYFMKSTEVCAVMPDKLDEWFPAWSRPLLREKGFRFVKLEVPQEALCFAGEYQVVIKRELCVERGEYLQ